MIESMLTTTDNPYDPFENYKAWNTYDVGAGYHTAAYLARIALNVTSLGEYDYNLFIEDAIDEIVKENINGMYKKVTREIPDPGEGVS